MYSTDNGPHMNSWPDAGMTPFRNEKNSNWEGAYRVPAVVRWPGRIPAGTVLNGIVSHNDWFVTLLAAAGNPDIAEQLKQGGDLNGTTYKVHLDGFNQLDYITGDADESPRRHYFYVSDDGDMTGLRFDNWKFVFLEQRAAGTLRVWAEPFTELRCPKIFNLRTDPFERADITSNTYYDWMLTHAYLRRAGPDVRRPDAPDPRGVPGATGTGLVQHRQGDREAEGSSRQLLSVATNVTDDPVAAFYERHPYPPPVGDLESLAVRARDGRAQRAAHHTIWPERTPSTVRSVLVAGCGTSQAARHALLRPGARVVGIDVSATAVEHTRRLAEQHGLANLEVRQLPIEEVAELGERFDHIVCTGVLHHLADPAIGLARLRSVLAPRGAVTLMVYARYGRFGVYLLQDYCRRLGLTTSRLDVADLVATLRELPSGHPVDRLLRGTRDFLDDDALADALLNPRDRAYDVPEVFELLAGAGLRFGRWQQQAPYRPDCGSIAETPHAARIAALPSADQWAAVELLRGTLTRHTVIAFGEDDEVSGRLDFSSPDGEAVGAVADADCRGRRGTAAGRCCGGAARSVTSGDGPRAVRRSAAAADVPGDRRRAHDRGARQGRVAVRRAAVAARSGRDRRQRRR